MEERASELEAIDYEDQEEIDRLWDAPDRVSEAMFGMEGKLDKGELEKAIEANNNLAAL